MLATLLAGDYGDVWVMEEIKRTKKKRKTLVV
jgi:hypothetical protein